MAGEVTTAVSSANFALATSLPVSLDARTGASSDRATYNLAFGGQGVITSTVKEKGTPDIPVARRVRLYRDRDGVLVGETWSHPTTGAYTFTELEVGIEYTAISFDHTGNFRAVAADKLTPAVP